MPMRSMNLTSDSNLVCYINLNLNFTRTFFCRASCQGISGSARERDWHAQAAREAVRAQARSERETFEIQRLQNTIAEAQNLVQDECLANGLIELDKLFGQVQSPNNVRVAYIDDVPLGPTGQLGRVPWVRPSVICRILEGSLQVPANYWDQQLRDYPNHPAQLCNTKKVGWAIHGDEGLGAGKVHV
jgi:hypothetical protein